MTDINSNSGTNDIENPPIKNDFIKNGLLKILFVTPNHLLTFLSTKEIIQLGQVCKAARAQIQSGAFNINIHLTHFFDDVTRFRSLQAQTGALISGSNALQFLDQKYYPDSDLDLFVWRGTALEIGRHLIIVQGYKFRPSQNPEETFEDSVGLPSEHLPAGWNPTDINQDEVVRYMNKGLYKVYDFFKPNGRKVQIVETSVSPIHCILCFHSTCVMNFISYNRAVSLYPYATFCLRRSLSFVSESPIENIGFFSKYSQRGWAITTKPIVDAPYLLGTQRHVQDQHTWHVPLDTTGIVHCQPLTASSPSFIEDPALYNGWRIDSLPAYRPNFTVIHSPLLRFNYLVIHKVVRRNINYWLKLQGRFQFTQLENVPEGEKNAAWVHWDAEIPTLWKPCLKLTADAEVSE